MHNMRTLRAIGDELFDLSDMLRGREAEVHVHIPDRRPEVRPQVCPKDVGRCPPSGSNER